MAASAFGLRCAPRAAVVHVVDARDSAIVALCNTITARPLLDGEEPMLGMCKACARKLTRAIAKLDHAHQDACPLCSADLTPGGHVAGCIAAKASRALL